MEEYVDHHFQLIERFVVGIRQLLGGLRRQIDGRWSDGGLVSKFLSKSLLALTRFLFQIFVRQREIRVR